MENIEFKELGIIDINNNILDHYNRYQEIKKCYRKEEGNWTIKNIEFIENWDNDKKEKVINGFLKTINNGGSVFGAYDNNKLIGFAVLCNKIFGSKRQYIQLDIMQVSYEYRHKGIGKKLFEMCIKKSKNMGIEKMYISANSSEETQKFYLGIGCKDVEEIDKELYEKEPFDRHMEYKINKRSKLYG
jgi:N-acetylglutamate synthase-like GNAT family acetyltransferase